MLKQNTRSLPKVYWFAGILISAFFVFIVKPERALAAACAASGDNVTISANCEWISGTTYGYTGTLTIDPGVTVTVVYDPAFAAQTVVSSTTMVINGTIDLNGQGYPAGEGPGAGTGSGGGGYGGTGGGTVGGSTYGDSLAPVDLGSGGAAAAGGGSIKLISPDGITFNGAIEANGASAAGGGGAGGSVWIVTSGISGTGTITAAGGAGEVGGGGGGRVSLTATAYSFSGSLSAQAGVPGATAGSLNMDTPAPSIRSLTPSHTAVGTTPEDIIVDGANFESSASTRLDGANKETSYTNSGRVTMLNVPVFDTPGYYTVTVYNSQNGKTSNEMTFTVDNPAPVLDGVTPSSKYVLDTDLAIQLIGSGFMAASQAYLDSVARSTTYVGPTQLIMNLLSSDLLVAGSHLITVVNPPPGSSTSSAATFTVLVRPSPSGGGASSVSYNYTTANTLVPPSAGFGKALGSSSIKWTFSSTPSNNIKGFHLVNADTGEVYATTSDPYATFITETGLNASTTYCNRAVKSYNATASSAIEPSSIFPCASTLPMAMATSSEFTSNPIKVINLGIEELEMGWTATSSNAGKGQSYGFYIPALSRWITPDVSSTAGILVYKLATLPFYQTIGQWGQDFRLIGLESNTPYKFLISKANNGVWEFSVTTTKGVLNFEAEMEMIMQESMPTPTASTTLSVLSGAAQRSWPSLAPVVFVGAVALVYHRHIKRRKKQVTKTKKQASKVKKTSRRKVSRKSKLAALFLVLGIGAASILGISVLPAKAEGVQTLTYSIKFKNTGSKTAKNVLVADPIPTGTLYYPGSLKVDGISQTDTHDSDNAWYSTGPDQVNFFWTSVAPGQTHEMKFSVYLQSGVKYEQVNNSATLQPENADPGSLPISIHEQSVCGNGKVEIKRDSNGSPIVSNGQVVWEMCDDGTNNGTGYGWCKADCSAVDLPPTDLCGNGHIDEWTNLKTGKVYKEICDQGSLNGEPGKCNLMCDGTVPLPPKPKPPEPPKKEEEKQPEKAEEATPTSGVSGGPMATTTVPVATTTEPVIAPTSTATTTGPAVQEAPPVSTGTTRVDAISVVITQAAAQASKALATPVVQETAIPVVGIVTAANVVAAGGWIPLLNYLYYIFTQPLMLIGRRKQKYGVVYNSLSKLPLDLAAVRVKDNSGRIVQTKVTDRLGRYNFLIPKGQYTLDISKPGYVFPTSLLSGKTQDVDYLDLLTNNKLSLSADAVISNNIPLDPKEDKRTPGQIKRKLALRHLQGGLSLLTTLLSIGAVVLVPSYQYLGLAAFQVVTYVVFRRLAYHKPSGSLGQIKDAKTGKPIKNAVIRVMDAQFNRILETQVADSSGHYSFLVGKGKFYLTVTKEGYAPLRSEVIDCSSAKGATVIDKQLKLAQAAQATARA